MAKKVAKKTIQPSKLELQHMEVVKQFQIPFNPLPDNYSLAQPSPLKVVRCVLVFGAYQEPIMAS